jgi:hypothetical protein
MVFPSPDIARLLRFSFPFLLTEEPAAIFVSPDLSG